MEPLEVAKLDLVTAYSVNSLFWGYLLCCGVDPKTHPVKQELDRIRTYMGKVKEIEDRKNAPRLRKDAARRFVQHAMFEPKDGPGKAKEPNAAGKEDAKPPLESATGEEEAKPSPAAKHGPGSGSGTPTPAPPSGTPTPKQLKRSKKKESKKKKKRKLDEDK